MESIFDVFNIVCSGVWGKTAYSTWKDITFLLPTSGYWMLWVSTKFYFCFCLSLDWDNHTVLPKRNLFTFIRFLCNCFHLMNCQCRERFDCEWVGFFGPYLCCWFTLFPDSSYCCYFSKHYLFGLELISCSSPHSSSRLSPISLFPPFSSANQSFLSFKT